MRHFVQVLTLLLFSFSFAFGETDKPFVYNDKGKRDPFFPLVDQSGRYLLETGLRYSPDELKLSGILWDTQGRSAALINNQIVNIGETIYGFKVKDITKNSVMLSREGKDYLLMLSEESKE